jgi:hypothetical protein
MAFPVEPLPGGAIRLVNDDRACHVILLALVVAFF